MKEYTPGEKHPDTPAWVYKNVWSRDKLAAILKTRCTKCEVVISSKEPKELVYRCGKSNCPRECMKNVYSLGAAHPVCEVCYDMWHSLYGNKGLKNYDYYKLLDDKDRAEAKRLKDNLEGKL